MQKQSSLWKTVLAAPGPDVVATWVTPQKCRVAGGLFSCGRYHETNFSVNRFKEWAVPQHEKKRALSVPESTGRRGLYKTLPVSGSCRGRPFLGRASVGSLKFSGVPRCSLQSNNIRTFVGVNGRSEEKKRKIRTLHKKMKGCGTQKLNPPQSLAHAGGRTGHQVGR